ncbi:LysR family transcriptional regulator [Actinomadura gamaensis]|uniref:LysR family transcriptional regulator n=1 Tax=Actinomadura gamaensis TaxID=1763541 RepID=A0ABV9U882_9ACTN
MELGPHHLRVIEAIASAGSINKAAARLGLTQPAVSTMLRRMETHLGVRLFERSPEGVRPTPVGAEVVARARAALSCIDDLNASLGARPGADPEVLRVGIQACPALTLLGDDLETLAPSLHLRVDPGAGRIPPLLASGGLDLGLFQEPLGRTDPPPPDVERFVLVEKEPLFVGLSSASPLASRDTLDLAELDDLDWIDDPLDDGPWPAYFRAACAAAGFQPRVRYWSTDWQIAASLIRSGRAIGVYQPTAGPREGIVFRRLTGDPLGQRLVLMWRPEAGAAARRLLDTLGEAYLRLVRAHSLYAEWWDAHPEAHPALPFAASEGRASAVAGEARPEGERFPGRGAPSGEPPADPGGAAGQIPLRRSWNAATAAAEPGRIRPP